MAEIQWSDWWQLGIDIDDDDIDEVLLLLLIVNNLILLVTFGMA